MNPIKRETYLCELINRKENGLIKVITGIRRCGKSYLLFNIYYEYLLSQGVSEENIIKISLDDEENEELREPKKLSAYIREKLSNNDLMHYVFIDEVQYAIKKEDLKSDKPLPLYGVLNGLLHKDNVDVYVTGSNSKLLSKDVMTEFRGRGDEVRIYPLTFKEFYAYTGGDKAEAFEEYALYGGLPLAVRRPVVAACHGRAVLCGAGAAHLVHPFGLRRTGPQCGAAAGGRRYHLVVAVTVLCAGHAGAGPGNGRTDVHYPQGTAAGTGAAGVQHPRKAGRITDATAATVAF